MQQQALQDSGDTRLTEQEASLIVALHSEREQKDGVTTLGDLAETLHISLAEAQQLLADVRSIHRGEPAVIPEPILVRKGLRVWPLDRFKVLVVLLLVAFAALAIIALARQNTTASEVPVSLVSPTPSPALPFHAASVLEFKQLTRSEFDVAVRLSDGYAVHALPSVSGPELATHSNDLSDVQARLAESIFESLEYAANHTPDNATDYYTIAVRKPSGYWFAIDVPSVQYNSGDGSLLRETESYNGRKLLRDQADQFVRQHWSQIEPTNP